MASRNDTTDININVFKRFFKDSGTTLTGTSLRQPVGIMLSFLWIDNLYVKNNSIIAELQVVRIRKINSFRHIFLAVSFYNNFQFLLTVPSIDGPANKKNYHLLQTTYPIVKKKEISLRSLNKRLWKKKLDKKPVKVVLPRLMPLISAICLERYSKCTFLHQKFNSFFKKNPALWSIKMRINNTLFDAQNAGNRISELLDFKFFWGSMPPNPTTEKGPYGPLSGHSRLLNLQWPLITNVIETPETTLRISDFQSSRVN